MKHKVIGFPLLFTLIALCSCDSTRHIDSVASGVSIRKIYIEENDAVLMEGFLPEMISQIQDLGFDTETYKNERPPEAVYYMTYTANWKWDMAMYLKHFRGTLYEDNKKLGTAVYDVSGWNPYKFGPTKEKLRPVLEELFSNVKRPGGASYGN